MKENRSQSDPLKKEDLGTTGEIVKIEDELDDENEEDVGEETSKEKRRPFFFPKKWPETSIEAKFLNETIDKLCGLQVHMGDRFQRDEILGYVIYCVKTIAPFHEGHKKTIMRMKRFLEKYDYFPQEDMQRQQEEEWQKQQLELQRQADGVGNIGEKDEKK